MQHWAIEFIRPESWSERFAEAGLDKPPGRVQSQYPTTDYDQADRTARHINELNPALDVKVVKVL